LTILMKDLTITKKYIAEKFKVSEVTIAKTYKSIEKYRDILISDEKTEKILKKLQKERDEIEMPPHIAEKYKQFQEKYENRPKENKSEEYVFQNNKQFSEEFEDLDELEELDIDDILEEAHDLNEEIELYNSKLDKCYKLVYSTS